MVAGSFTVPFVNVRESDSISGDNVAILKVWQSNSGQNRRAKNLDANLASFAHSQISYIETSSCATIIATVPSPWSPPTKRLRRTPVSFNLFLEGLFTHCRERIQRRSLSRTSFFPRKKPSW